MKRKPPDYTDEQLTRAIGEFPYFEDSPSYWRAELANGNLAVRALMSQLLIRHEQAKNIEQIILDHQPSPDVVALGRLQFWATTAYTRPSKARHGGLDGQIMLRCMPYHAGFETPPVMEIPLTPWGDLTQIEHDYSWKFGRDCIGRYVKRAGDTIELFDFTRGFDPS